MSRTYRNRRSNFTNYYKIFDPTSYIYSIPIKEQDKILSLYYKDGRREWICNCTRCTNLVLALQKECKAKKEIDNLVKDFYNNLGDENEIS